MKRTGFILADVQSDVLSPSRVHVIAFSIDQQLRQFLNASLYFSKRGAY